MFGGTPDWGELRPLPHHVRVDCTDTGDTTWVRLGTSVGTHPETGTTYDEGDIGVVPDHGTRGGRRGEVPGRRPRRLAGGAVAMTARPGCAATGVYDRFRLAVAHPID